MQLNSTFEYIVPTCYPSGNHDPKDNKFCTPMARVAVTSFNNEKKGRDVVKGGKTPAEGK